MAPKNHAQVAHCEVGRLEEAIVTREELRFHCPNTLNPIGCAKIGYGGALCWIFLAPDEDIGAHGLTTELVLRHEIGHCNGWRHDHPGARALPSTLKNN
jgi:hypothetical protein